MPNTPTAIGYLAATATATTATVIDRVTATAGLAAAVVFEQQDNTDDEQNPCPSTILAAEEVRQTHNKFLLCSLPVGGGLHPILCQGRTNGYNYHVCPNC